MSEKRMMYVLRVKLTCRVTLRSIDCMGWIINVCLSSSSSSTVHSVLGISVVTCRFQMHRRLLASAAVAPVTLITIPTLYTRLTAVCVTIHVLRLCWVVILHDDDLVLVLDTAASVTAARVVLRSETLELDLNLMFWITAVSSSTAAPAHLNISRATVRSVHVAGSTSVLRIHPRLQPPGSDSIQFIS